jgi:hypothetical protein
MDRIDGGRPFASASDVSSFRQSVLQHGARVEDGLRMLQTALQLDSGYSNAWRNPPNGRMHLQATASPLDALSLGNNPPA